MPAAGWAQFPMTEYIGPDPMVFPDSEELREKLFSELARASGHTNKNEVWKFYPTPKELGKRKTVVQKLWQRTPR